MLNVNLMTLMRGAVFFCRCFAVKDAFPGLLSEACAPLIKHEIMYGKPVNNLTLDIWKRVVHNELTFMIFIENAGGRNDGCTI